MAETHVQRQYRLRKLGRKHCLRCDTEKTLSDFYERPHRPGSHVPLCKSCVLKRSAEYRATRVDYYRAKNQAWAAAHPGYSTAWARAHRQQHLEQHQRSRTRLLGQFVEEVDRRVLWESHDGRCGICSEPVTFDEFHIDHIVPVSKGGLHTYANTQPTHRVCNQRKSLEDRRVA